MSTQPWILKRSTGFHRQETWYEIWVDNRTPVLTAARIYGDFAERIVQLPVLEQEILTLRHDLKVAMEQAELLEAELAKIRAEDALWEVAERDVR